MTIQDAVALFLSKVEPKPSNYYCGITNNLKERKRQHNATFCASLKCKDVETPIN